LSPYVAAPGIFIWAIAQGPEKLSPPVGFRGEVLQEFWGTFPRS